MAVESRRAERERDTALRRAFGFWLRFCWRDLSTAGFFFLTIELSPAAWLQADSEDNNNNPHKITNSMRHKDLLNIFSRENYCIYQKISIMSFRRNQAV
jgi:hypothetical protein